MVTSQKSQWGALVSAARRQSGVFSIPDDGCYPVLFEWSLSRCAYIHVRGWGPMWGHWLICNSDGQNPPRYENQVQCWGRMFIKHGRVGPGVGALGAQDRVIVAAYWEALTRLCGRLAALIGWVVARPRRRPETQKQAQTSPIFIFGGGWGGGFQIVTCSVLNMASLSGRGFLAGLAIRTTRALGVCDGGKGISPSQLSVDSGLLGRIWRSEAWLEPIELVLVATDALRERQQFVTSLGLQENALMLS